MKTSFGFINNNITEINNWHQLLNLKSSIKNISCSVNTIKDDICDGLSITIYNNITNFIYVSFFVYGDDKKQVNTSNLTVSTDEAIDILNSFGYNVSFVSMIVLTTETRDLLKSLYDIGYRFVYKDHNGYPFVSRTSDLNDPSNQIFDISNIPNYRLSDFSFINDVDHIRFYSIENLLNQ